MALSGEEYTKIISQIYELIMSEMNGSVSRSELPTEYPKFVTMHEFFRLLRGEGFYNARPHFIEKQDDFYKMENQIGEKLNEIKKRIDFNDNAVIFNIEKAKKNYDVLK